MKTPTLEQAVERAEAFAKTCPRGKTAAVTIAMCSVCGFMEWVHSGPENEGAKVIVQPFDQFMYERQCMRCTEIQQRYPELYRWITNVIAQHQLDLDANAALQSDTTEPPS